jgi:DNA-directed RNA polymerase alpha subunit
MKQLDILNNYEKLDYIHNVLDQGYSHAPDEYREVAKQFVDDIRRDLDVTPHILKHRHIKALGPHRESYEVDLDGKGWRFVSVRAFHAMKNAKINNLDELKEIIKSGKLFHFQNCGRKTVWELSELAEYLTK